MCVHARCPEFVITVRSYELKKTKAKLINITEISVSVLKRETESVVFIS